MQTFLSRLRNMFYQVEMYTKEVVNCYVNNTNTGGKTKYF